MSLAPWFHHMFLPVQRLQEFNEPTCQGGIITLRVIMIKMMVKSMTMMQMMKVLLAKIEEKISMRKARMCAVNKAGLTSQELGHLLKY